MLETLFDVRQWYSYTLFLKDLTVNPQANCRFFVKWQLLIMLGLAIVFGIENGLTIVALK